eukprot:9565800-Karenia_brevis.AAC.1
MGSSDDNHGTIRCGAAFWTNMVQYAQKAHKGFQTRLRELAGKIMQKGKDDFDAYVIKLSND